MDDQIRREIDYLKQRAVLTAEALEALPVIERLLRTQVAQLENLHQRLVLLEDKLNESAKKR